MPLADIQQKLSEQRSSHQAQLEAAYQRGREDAIQELTPRIAEIAEQSLIKTSAAREIFRAQVSVHAMGAELLRMKTAMANNQCWQCGERPPHATSSLRRCTVCDKE